MRPITSLVIHHSLTTDGLQLADANAIRHYHITTLGWDDIGYHLIQESVGGKPNLVIGRPWPITGAHAPGRNIDSIGYCIVGNFDEAPPDTATWATAVKTVRWLMDLFKLDREDVFGHREVTPHRTCPGKHFNLGRFREAL